MKTRIFEKCIKIAYKLIELPDAHNKHFSFIVIRNKILSVGWNLSFTTHPIANKYGYRFSSIHSELKSLREFPYPPSVLSKCVLINIRIMSDGTIGMSRPCVKCQKLLRDFGISKIYYTNRDGKFIGENLNDLL